MMQAVSSLSIKSIQYYAIARKWTSELEFFKFECGFLNALIVDFAGRYQEENPLQKLANMMDRLHNLDQNIAKTGQTLDNQTRRLELMAEDILPEDPQALAGMQVELEYTVADITSRFRALKAELYNLLSGSMPGLQCITG